MLDGKPCWNARTQALDRLKIHIEGRLTWRQSTPQDETLDKRRLKIGQRQPLRLVGPRQSSCHAAKMAYKHRMIPWQQIDTARVPGAKVELRLMRRGTEFSMMLGQNELMNSRLSGSEEALATLACRRIEAVMRPHVLIGGLGMGFTLRAALAVLGAEARIVVAELVPAVIAWARGPMADLFGDSLADPRASIRSADVIEVIGSHPSAFDAILLDVDNGPEGLIRKANDALYDIKGLKAIRQSLRPGGVVAVWSSGPNASFTKRLRDAGFDVNEVAVRATAKRSGARHVIWFATRS
jgi:spermidine synthase